MNDWQSWAALAAVLLALLYLAARTGGKAKKGCGNGCGCGKKREP
jgi:hypothetical protein